MPTDNIIPFSAEATDPDQQELKRRREFDRLWSLYSRGAARISYGCDAKLDALMDRQSDIIWRIIRTPAPVDYHLSRKFELLRELMDQRWADNRHRGLLESIYNEVLDPASL